MGGVINAIPEQPLREPFKPAVRGCSVSRRALIDSIGDEGNRACVRPGIVPWNVAEERDLVAPLVSVLPLPPPVAVAVPFVSAALLYVVINIGPFKHLGEIQRHPVKRGSSLGVRVDVFVVVSSNGRGTRH